RQPYQCIPGSSNCLNFEMRFPDNKDLLRPESLSEFMAIEAKADQDYQTHRSNRPLRAQRRLLDETGAGGGQQPTDVANTLMTREPHQRSLIRSCLRPKRQGWIRQI